LDVDGDDGLGQAREQPRFDQGRLATTARSEDVAHPEGLVRVHLFDADLPEVDGFGEPVATTGTGEQFEEEVGGVLVVGPKALGDDHDGLLSDLAFIHSDRQRTSEFLTALPRDIGAVSTGFPY